MLSFLVFLVSLDETLLEAEWSALKNKKKGLALRSFESAALLAGRRGLIHLQALANERFAIYLQDIGQTQDSLYRFQEAVALYEEWGATCKVEELQSRIDQSNSTVRDGKPAVVVAA